MMRFVLLLALALPAWAQQAQTPPAEPKKEAERRPLNLRLDNPSSFATVAPEEKKPQQKGLPTLGDDARKIEVPQTAGARSEGGPYPKDMNPNSR